MNARDNRRRAQVIAAALAMAASPLAAQALFSHDNNAPVNYAADKIELQDRDQRVLLTGNVQVTQGTLTLTATRVTVNYTNAGALKIQRMIAAGNVHVTQPGQSARGEAAVYDFNQRVITMAGNVALDRNGDTLNGGRLVINLATGQSSVDGRASGGEAPGVTGRSGGRVSGTFAAPKSK